MNYYWQQCTNYLYTWYEKDETKLMFHYIETKNMYQYKKMIQKSKCPDRFVLFIIIYKKEIEFYSIWNECKLEYKISNSMIEYIIESKSIIFIKSLIQSNRLNHETYINICSKRNINVDINIWDLFPSDRCYSNSLLTTCYLNENTLTFLVGKNNDIDYYSILFLRYLILFDCDLDKHEVVYNLPNVFNYNEILKIIILMFKILNNHSKECILSEKFNILYEKFFYSTNRKLINNVGKRLELICYFLELNGISTDLCTQLLCELNSYNCTYSSYLKVSSIISTKQWKLQTIIQYFNSNKILQDVLLPELIHIIIQYI